MPTTQTPTTRSPTTQSPTTKTPTTRSPTTGSPTTRSTSKSTTTKNLGTTENPTPQPPNEDIDKELNINPVLPQGSDNNLVSNNMEVGGLTQKLTGSAVQAAVSLISTILPLIMLLLL